MAISFHPTTGTILVCDFRGYEVPEMQKRRPVIVISPRFRDRTGLCTIVPLSTTPPRPVAPYHYKLHTAPPLPEPYNADYHWVKGDMLYTVSFKRLFLLCSGKDAFGERVYDPRVISDEDLSEVRRTVLHGIGMGDLTKYT